MGEWTGKERVAQFLKRLPMDRVPIFEHINENPGRRWKEEGHLPAGDDGVHFGFDILETGGLRTVADLDFQEQELCEDEETVTTLDGNGAAFRRHKANGGAPYPVSFTVANRRDWEERVKPLLLGLDSRRLPGWYGGERARAEATGQFFCFTGHFVFDRLHPLIGYERLFLAMHDDPAWVRDMVETYCGLIINHLEELTARHGKPDGFCLYEDIGFLGHSFLSPAMYREFFLPAQKRFIDWAHGIGCPVILHSSGNVEALLPHMLESGMDCLQTLHVKSGMDVVRLYRQYGDRLSFLGGIDGREMASNDRKRIDTELERVLPVVKQGYGYCLHSDFCVPAAMEHDSFVYFLERGKQLGRY